MMRGIRGATTVREDSSQEVLTATRELLEAIRQSNGFKVDDIASILFTVTQDVRSAFPAEAARSIGWDRVPLLCFQEIQVPGSLPRCIRVLVHVNTEMTQQEIKHVYLHEAAALRRDLTR